MPQKIAKIISVVFHPVLLPSMGMMLMLYSGFYFSMISWDAKRFILLVVLFSTGVLPMLSVAILALNPRFEVRMEKSQDRVLPLLFSSVSYYLGYLLMNKMRAFPVFKLFLIASVLVIIILLLVSFRWKISNHMAALGGLTGTLLALSFRTGVNPVWAIAGAILVSGVVGTARLALDKHTIWEIIAGYTTGFTVLYLVIYFV